MPGSNMPSYPWLKDALVDGEDIQARMKVLRSLGDPYSDEDIAGAPAKLEGVTELQAIVAYLQGLGLNRDAGQTPLDTSP